MKRLTTLRGTLLCLLLALGVAVVPPSPTAEALDVYITPGTHLLNGREWKTDCEKYSSTVERCRTEIKATTIAYTRGRYVQSYGWTFNNLTYKPSARSQWAGNVLATPGEHISGGRRWKTECDTSWTGLGACRSSIWMTTYTAASSGRGYVAKEQWVFNNIVRFTDRGPAVAEFCVPTGQSLSVAGEERALSVASEDRSLSVASEERASDDEGPPQPAAQPEAATVAIRTVRHPEYPAGALYDRLGDIEISGTTAGLDDGARLSVELRDATGKVRSSSQASVAAGAYTAYVQGGFDGAATVVVTGPDGSQATLAVTLRTAGATLSAATRINPLGTTAITGTVEPAIGDLRVTAMVPAYGGWASAGEGRTAADGTYRLDYTFGQGTLGTQQVRICVELPWGATIPADGSLSIERARIANPVITDTTAAEVALTYRDGCPVGPSGLSTIRINQQSMDGRVYRGEIIVRRNRAAEVADVFTRTFEAGFPVFQMTNPNAFGADDIAMMAANNTSGFNCRKVVGNPYAMSPHSYGYAVDVNPVQNPYRDPNGVWHPSTQHVQRTPVVPGMLTTTSAPVKAFQAHGWSWFSGWDWHHFEKR